MGTKCYAVVSNKKDNGDHSIQRFSKKSDADDAARQNKAKLYEYDQPLGIGEDHKKGRLIADYSTLE